MPLSPTLDTIREAIKAQLTTGGGPLTGIPFYESPIEVFIETDIRDKFKDPSGRLHWYWIEREAATEEESDTRGRFLTSHVIALHGFMAVRDPAAGDNSYITFSDEVESVRDKLRLNSTVFGTPDRPNVSPRTAQLRSFGAEMVMDHLVWHAIIELRVEAFEDKAF
jgi:hypothetical protein